MRDIVAIVAVVLLVAPHLVAPHGNYHQYNKNYRRHNKRTPAKLYEDFQAGNDDEEKNCHKDQLNVANPKMKATNIAAKAAQEAKAASDAQAPAAQEAAHLVKTQLAEKAASAAKAAEAALAGKQQIVEQLETEVREAESVVQEESASLQNTQINVEAAVKAAQQAKSQLVTLTQAVKTAQSNVNNAEQAAMGAQQGLAEKSQLVEAAKNRVEQLLRQLCAARSDFDNTRKSAQKAASAANEAKANAQRNRRMLARRHQGGHGQRAPRAK